MATDRVQRRFDLLKQRQEQEFSKAADEQNQNLEREAAKRGALGSGVTQKLRMQGTENIARAKADANLGLDSQREAALQQVEEQEAGRKFAREERLGSQEFATGERLGSQKFAAGESALQRGLSEKFFNKEMAFKKKVQGDQNKQFSRQMQLALKQFKLDERVSEFNMDMAKKQWEKKDVMEWFANMHGYDPRTGGWGTPGAGLAGGAGAGGNSTGGSAFPSLGF